MDKKEVKYEHVDVLLVDPGYVMIDGWDDDFEMYGFDLVIDTFADGAYLVFRGKLDDYDDEKDEFEEERAMGNVCVDSARIGVCDYNRAIKEEPELKRLIEEKPFLVTVIRDFTGTINYMTDEFDEVHVIGISDDGKRDFFTM